MNILSRAALAALCAVALSACVKVDIDEARVFKPPQGRGATTVEAMSLTGQEELAPATLTHGFLGEGHARIAYTLVRKPGAQMLTVMCGGNANDRQGSGVGYAKRALPYGDVLLFDYPGYGDSGGKASEASMKAMLANVREFAVAQAGEGKLALWGHSLGGFVCSQLTGQIGARASGLVIEASALNVEEVAASWTPWYARPFAQVNILPSLRAYDSGAALSAFPGRILVLGAGADKTLEVKLAKSLSKDLARRGRTAEYVEFPGAEHSGIPEAAGFRAAIDAWYGRL